MFKPSNYALAAVICLSASCGNEDRRNTRSQHSEQGRGEAAVSPNSSVNDGSEFDLAAAAKGKSVLGPFTPAPALSLYWLNDPTKCRARVRVSSVLGEKALLRIYQVSTNLGGYREKLLNKFLITLPKASSSQNPSTQSFELSVPSTAMSDSMIEIRLSAGQNRLKAYFEADCEIKDADYGVSFQNGSFSPWRGLQTEHLYAYVPYRSEVLVFSNRGKKPVSIRGVNRNGQVDGTTYVMGPVNGPVQIAADQSLPVIPGRISWPGQGHSDVLWRFDFSESQWKFAAGGFPLILSPSAEAVRRIRAGMVFDGQRVLAHAFQRDYLKSIRPRMAYKTGNTAKLAQDFADMLKAGEVSLGSFPNAYLTNAKYGVLSDFRSALEAQNLNPKSDWLGSSDGWQLRDPWSTSYVGTDVLIPQTIYASSVDQKVWQLVLNPISGAINQKITNSVQLVQGSTLRYAPLSNPTRWNRLSIAAPIVLDSATSFDPTQYILNNQSQMVHGASKMDDSLSPSLALMATLDGSKAQTPFHNPFYAEKTLLYRAALAAMTDLASLPESEVWNSIETDLGGHYAGGNIAFTMGRKVLISYGEVANLLRKLFCSSAPTTAEKTLYNCSQFPTPALSFRHLPSVHKN
jgi:hypothetical protein